MAKFIRYTWVGLFIIFGLLAVFVTMIESDYPGLVDTFNYLIYLICFLLALPLTISWLRIYDENKRSALLIPVFLPALLLIVLILISISHSKRRNVPVFLKAAISDISIEFRNDSTYRMSSFSDFVAESDYGTFHSIGDTVIFNNVPELTTGKFLITKFSIDSSNRQGSLLEIDQNGIIDSAARFPILLDNRNIVPKASERTSE